MKMIQIKTASATETAKVASSMAKLLKGGEIIALSGELGSGKTVFVKGLAKGLGIKQRITSPTFVLVKPYEFNKRLHKSLFHFDLYRLNRVNELEELGFAEIINNPKHVSAIEWPEKAQKLLPPGTVMIKLAVGANTKERIIKVWSKK